MPILFEFTRYYMKETRRKKTQQSKIKQLLKIVLQKNWLDNLIWCLDCIESSGYIPSINIQTKVFHIGYFYLTLIFKYVSKPNIFLYFSKVQTSLTLQNISVCIQIIIYFVKALWKFTYRHISTFAKNLNYFVYFYGIREQIQFSICCCIRSNIKLIFISFDTKWVWKTKHKSSLRLLCALWCLWGDE